MERISIQDLSAILIPRSGLKKKEAEQLATAMFDIIKEGLAADRLVKIKGLGTFKVIDIESRESIDVTNGQRMLIEGHDKITFTPDATMKDLVNKPFSQFETVVLNEGVDFDDASAYEALRLPLTDDDDDDEMDEVQQAEAVAEKEPAVKPELSVEPEPAALPEPVVEKEPVVKPELAVEPEPAAMPEDVVELEPAAQPEPIAESETSVRASLVAESKSQPTPKTQDENNTELPPIVRHSFWLMLASVACIVAFTAGYLMGMSHAKAKANVGDQNMEVTLAEIEEQPTAEKKATTPDAPAAEQPIAQSEPMGQPKPTDKEHSDPTQASKSEERLLASDDKYEQMDARVRTGAYRIVGTAEVVTVKTGETLKRISKAYLGDGMECYVEVYNGLPPSGELKAGQTLKIPKLELKKKRQK